MKINFIYIKKEKVLFVTNNYKFNIFHVLKRNIVLGVVLTEHVKIKHTQTVNLHINIINKCNHDEDSTLIQQEIHNSCKRKACKNLKMPCSKIIRSAPSQFTDEI